MYLLEAVGEVVDRAGHLHPKSAEEKQGMQLCGTQQCEYQQRNNARMEIAGSRSGAHASPNRIPGEGGLHVLMVVGVTRGNLGKVSFLMQRADQNCESRILKKLLIPFETSLSSEASQL